LLKADDAADPRLFARFAIGLILCTTILSFCVKKEQQLKNMMLASILFIFISSWINEKFIPVPTVAAWLAYDYRFISTVFGISLAVAGIVLVYLLPIPTDKFQYKMLFVALALSSVLASVDHLIDVQKAYARFDVQARKYIAKVFLHEQPTGIHLPHSRWHPDGTFIKLYVCLEEPDCNPEGTTFYTGYVRDLYPVKLRSSALVASARELATWRERSPNGPLVGYWKLDEPNPRDMCVDSSGNGYAGKPNSTTVAQGKRGRTRSFNGRGDYIGIPPINIANAITVAAWVYSDNFVQNGSVVTKNPVNTQWALFFESDGYLKWRGGGTENDVKCGAPSNGNWHHIVAKQDGTTASLYVDGLLCASGAVPPIGNAANSITIGRFDGGDPYYFTGRIDEVRIYNRALSDAEISQLLSVTDSGSHPSLPTAKLR
jgi:hypothetical protein